MLRRWEVFAGALHYADDLTILAPSVDDLQICETFADFHPIRFNGHKNNLLCSVKVFGLLTIAAMSVSSSLVNIWIWKN